MLKKLVVVLIVVFMAACAKTPAPPKPTNVILEIEASANLNPNSEGRSSPLALRVYELKSLADFNKTDFVTLYGNDKAVLGANLVQKYEFTLQPEDKKSIKFEAADDTKAIAAFGIYRQYEQAQWKVSVPVESHKTNSVLIKAGSDKLEMSSSVAETGKSGK